MSKPGFHRVGVSANLYKDDVRALLKDFIPLLLREGFHVSIEPDIEPILGDKAKGVDVGITKECDVIAALGGDGTILKVARDYAMEEIPIMGVKAGTLGFLAEALKEDSLKRIREGRFIVQERMRITATVKEDGRSIKRLGALNDVVVHGSGFSRMVNLKTEVDGRPLRDYAADGVIIATPTGSTAYSLSAGGPLLAPTMEAIVVTPLCPHTMSIRPIVLDSDEIIVIRVASGRPDIMVTVDGQEGIFFEEGQYVEVKKSDRVTKLVVPEDYDFFNLLREKL